MQDIHPGDAAALARALGDMSDWFYDVNLVRLLKTRAGQA
jgi:hypothetical protein